MHSISVYKEDKLLKAQKIADHVAISIGRHKLNDIHLPDSSAQVSRFHVALFRDAEGRYWLQDLGSRNRTSVNGKTRDFGLLADGDKIGIGPYTLVLQEHSQKSKAEKPGVTLIDEEADGDVKTILSPIPIPSEDLEPLKTDPEGLLLLYQLSRFANLGSDLEESLQAITEELATTFQPDRMFVALLEPDGTSLTCLARFPLDEAETKFSRTMLRQLLHEKQVLIIQDALTDERLMLQGKPARSVLEQHIQSAICIPLQWGGEIKGILYLDSSKETGRFTSRDLKLLTHVGKDLSALLERGLDYRSVRDEKLRLESRLAVENTIIGITPKIKEILKTIGRLAATDATVLLTGETGTGKDLAARVIHQNSRRKGKPFIEINCAAIPENILESELFGVIAHYPGFHNKEALKGRFELAHSGTVFLNEIGDLPPLLQAKLLDVLEKKQIWPLGKNQPTPVDMTKSRKLIPIFTISSFKSSMRAG
jgi:transcriptional regulator with GAF, ATPase, and Fis domain